MGDAAGGRTMRRRQSFARLELTGNLPRNHETTMTGADRVRLGQWLAAQ
jgi:hypothetical protein